MTNNSTEELPLTEEKNKEQNIIMHKDIAIQKLNTLLTGLKITVDYLVLKKVLTLNI